MDLHENLEYQFRENLMEMGKGHQEAADQVLVHSVPISLQDILSTRCDRIARL